MKGGLLLTVQPGWEVEMDIRMNRNTGDSGIGRQKFNRLNINGGVGLNKTEMILGEIQIMAPPPRGI